ncbi:mitochondrial ribosomal death-associated protein 3-domain-containing protein [Pisolithus orientalis]|uniref:mitochondrial ribosomal death-associated protein 3-domain-containing protein n=1 Tax=Pisolithus orientalis TaxID=936130 RepID=UPI002224C4D1|nr:mitochondrial ribosomal death-associated protein 3-domain-containing protein [Pisolithus orientalis]KAI6010683.1 mitochondrial ribosomal death-associated protein 3-domain-containing protein [Pisolithus orientalis]
MLPLSSCCRHATRSLLAFSDSNAACVGLPALSTQVRSYAKARPGAVKPSSHGFSKAQKKGKGGELEDTDQAVATKRKRYTAFLPMPVAQLTHPLFETDRRNSQLQLQNFHPEILTEAVISQALAFPQNDKDPSRIFGLPRNLLVEYRILSKPCSVIRGVTIDVINRLDLASQEGQHKPQASDCRFTWLLERAFSCCKHYNTVICGTGSCYTSREGKNNSTVVASDQSRQLYDFLRSNCIRKRAWRWSVEEPVPAGTTLADLVKVGTKEQVLAPTVLTAVLSELGKQTAFPVLLAIDDFQAIYCKTKYRDPHYSRIQPYHLSMPRLLLEYASGLKQFARGAVVGALSGTDTTFKLPLELAEVLGLPPTSHSGPYAKRVPELQSYAKGLSRVSVPDALAVSEATELFDVWTRDRAIPAAPNDELFLAKYSESGGNARDFIWKDCGDETWLDTDQVPARDEGIIP